MLISGIAIGWLAAFNATLPSSKSPLLLSVGCRVCKIVPAASPAATDPATTKNEIKPSTPLTEPAAVPASKVIVRIPAAPAAAFGLEAAENVKTSPATYPSPGLLITAAVALPAPLTVKSNVAPTPATEVVDVGAVSYTHLTLPTKRIV